MHKQCACCQSQLEGSLDCSSVLCHSDPCFACCLLSLSDIAHGRHYVLHADTDDISTVAFRSFAAPRQPYQNTCELALDQELEDLHACIYKHCVQLMFNRWSRLEGFWQRYKLGPLASEIRAKAEIVLVTGCTVFVLREYGIEVSVCTGPSMLPTFNPKGDILLYEHFSTNFRRIQIGDVVLARSVQDPKQTVCKRVLGMEGDEVRIPQSTRLGPGRTVKVPQGHVWLQGDNALNSTDSRHYGPVPYALLRGRVFVRVWPLHAAGFVSSEIPDFYYRV